jgi:hypothetical protein
MARAKHRWKRTRDQRIALVHKIERQRKHKEMLEEHKNIKKAGLRAETKSMEPEI